jgi:TonB family protein
VKQSFRFLHAVFVLGFFLCGYSVLAQQQVQKGIYSTASVLHSPSDSSSPKFPAEFWNGPPDAELRRVPPDSASRKLWKKFGDTTEIMYNEYLPELADREIYDAMILVDTPLVDPESHIFAPLPEKGMMALADSTDYPYLDRIANANGTAYIGATIDKNGNATDVSIKHTGDGLFDSSAVRGVSRTKFTPALMNGLPVETQVLIAFHFKSRTRTRINAEILELDWHWGPCYGACPAITYAMHRDGTVEYTGDFNAERKGRWRATMDTNEFNRLTSLLVTMHFFDMTRYPGSRDRSWLTITMKTATKSNEVSTDYYPPLMEVDKFVRIEMNRLVWAIVGD